MSDALFVSIVLTGFAVAFFHAALPTHWLPFVLVGRAQGWSARKIALVTAAAGAAHVLSTVVLGAIVASAGLAIERWLGTVAAPLAAAVLFGLGLFYLARHALAGRRLAGPAGLMEPPARRYASDRAAVGALVLMLTLSPCEAFLPIYLSAASYGWGAFALLSLTLAIATAAGMTVFTAATLAGFQRLKLQALERYDSAILGGVLCLLAVAVLLLE